MTLVFATSRGVVMAAAVPPAIAPHTAPCHGSRGEPCSLLHVDYNIIIIITTVYKLNNHMHSVFLTLRNSHSGYWMKEKGTSLAIVEK